MSDQTANAVACQNVSALHAEHKQFEPLVGTFNAVVRMWMGPGDPMEMTGTMVNELDLGGRYLRQTYTGDGADGPFGAFEGRGYLGYNTVTNQYEGVWIDTASTFMMNQRGSRDGNRWEMVGQFANPGGEGTLKQRSVIEIKGKDNHTMTMFMTMPDGNEVKNMEITYKRA